MIRTPNLDLPIYDKPDEDVFDLQEWNGANTSIDGAYKEIIDIKDEIERTNASAEVIEARMGEETLGAKMSKVSTSLEQINTKKADLKYTNENLYKLHNKNIPKIFKPFDYPTGFLGTYKPVTLYYDGKNFKTDFKKENFMYSGGKTYYISPTGDWQNDGLSRDKPVKLYQALTRAVDGDTIVVIKSVYLAQDLDQVEYNVAKNINIIGEDGAIFIFGGRKVDFVKDNTTNLWKFSIPYISRIISAVDFDFEYVKKATFSECQNNINSYFTDTSNNIYINSISNPSDSIILLAETTGLVCKNTENCRLYIENLTIMGGGSNFKTSKSKSHNLEVILNNVKFKYNVYNTSSLKFSGGNILSVNTSSMYSKGDGFGYTNLNDSNEVVTTNFFEINCIGANNGIGGTQDNMNGSTAHSGIKGIRVNGLYYNNFGGNVADVQEGTQSVNCGCDVFDSCATSANQGFGLQQAGTEMWLYNCNGYGNSADVVAYGGTTVHIKDCNFGYVAGGGIINYI